MLHSSKPYIAAIKWIEETQQMLQYYPNKVYVYNAKYVSNASIHIQQPLT